MQRDLVVLIFIVTTASFKKLVRLYNYSQYD